MKNTITIRMGASRWDVLVKHDGELLAFDLYHMTRDQRGEFFRTFSHAVRRFFGKPE